MFSVLKWVRRSRDLNPGMVNGPRYSNTTVFALHLKCYDPWERIRRSTADWLRVSAWGSTCSVTRGRPSGIWLFRDLGGLKRSHYNFRNCTSSNPRDKLGQEKEKLGEANKGSCATAWISMEVVDPCNSSNYWGALGFLSTSDPGSDGEAVDKEAFFSNKLYKNRPSSVQ